MTVLGVLMDGVLHLPHGDARLALRLRHDAGELRLVVALLAVVCCELRLGVLGLREEVPELGLQVVSGLEVVGLDLRGEKAAEESAGGVGGVYGRRYLIA